MRLELDEISVKLSLVRAPACKKKLKLLKEAYHDHSLQ